MFDRSVVIRMATESILIIASILLALSADAWWESRNRQEQLVGHLNALERDFDTMLDRIDASHQAASRGAQAGVQLSSLLQQRLPISPEAARQSFWHLVFYEVFTPSPGAYSALVDSGNLELLEDDDLKLALADFFGSFEDTRASEELQLDTQVAIFQTSAFSELVGWHRMGQANVPVADDMPTERWAESSEVMNAIGIMTVRQYDLLEDYEYLRGRIVEIASLIDAATID